MTIPQRRPIHTGRRWVRRAAPLAAALLVAMGGCSGTPEVPEPQVAQSPEPAPEPEPEPEPESPAPEVFWPLTGLPVDDPKSELEDGEFGPALSVKIENSIAARPQEGLAEADVVWEELVEGGMTRFVAMYHSDLPAALGPVRSIRPMDAAIAGPVGGVLAFSGGHYAARAQSAGLVIASDDGGYAGFYRNSERSSSHSLFGDPQVLLGHGEGLDPAREIFTFAEEPDDASALAGEAVERVDLRFPASQPSWRWDGKVWQRFESGAPAVVVGGDQLQADNVIVARVQLWDTGARDGNGAPVLETILTGEGPLTVFSGGHMIEGTWAKGADNEPLLLKQADGKDIVLASGKTWVELLPTTGSMAVSEAP